jgi:type IV secretion system protein VirB6
MDVLGTFFFELISGFIDRRFFELSEAVSGKLGGMLSGLGVVTLTIYFIMLGLRIATGESRESMSSIVLRLSKMLLLLSILTTSVFGSGYLQNSILGVRDNIVGAFDSGGGISGQNVYQKIDSNLDGMATTMSLVNSVSTGTDVGLADAKSRALTLGLAGQAAPPIVAGLLVLVNELGMRIAIMLAPIFIVAFMFKKTEDMFYTWVKYMIGSMLTLGVLSMAIAILFELSNMFYIAIELMRTAADLGVLGSNTLPQLNESVMTAGFGFIMTAMLISVPAIVSRLIGSDSMGHVYSQFSGYGGGGGAAPASSPAARAQQMSSQASDNQPVSPPVNSSGNTLVNSLNNTPSSSGNSISGSSNYNNAAGQPGGNAATTPQYGARGLNNAPSNK